MSSDPVLVLDIDGVVSLAQPGGPQPWNADLQRDWGFGSDELAKIKADPAAFLASLDDREGKGAPITLPDGSQVKRLPGYRRWLWDGEFCGHIGFRWQPGTSALPPYVLGHIGYGVVPSKRGRGYATRALALMLPEARKAGLTYVELTTDTDNLPSQKVISANGGILVERFNKAEAHGGDVALRWRIVL